MTLYVVSRPRVFLSEEEVAAAAGCISAVNAAVSEHVRWVRSYVVSEVDGTFSAYCLYEATSAEALEEHSEVAMLPADSIKPVATTLVPA